MPNRPDKLRLSAILMILTIIGIAAFQGYWLKKLYSEKWTDLKKETDVAFRDVLYKIQLQHFHNDTVFFKRRMPDNLFLLNVLDSIRYKFSDSLDPHPDDRNANRNAGANTDPNTDPNADTSAHKWTISIETNITPDSPGNKKFFKKMVAMQGVTDSGGSTFPSILKLFSGATGASMLLSTSQIDSAYKKELLKNAISVPFTIRRIRGKENQLERALPRGQLTTSFVSVGLNEVYAYQATFDNPFGYILRQIRLPVLMSLLLLVFTTACLVFLYRNLRQQQRLAAIKNEFISNMTHELKTPISTVRVAVEALRHFDALDNPERTREYLDISALELQRLSTLVDKVLKLSLFENKEIGLNKTPTDLHALAAEVIASMKLQLEKAGAFVQLTGDPFTISADRMHMSSVLSNLLDNALKYSKADPAITVHLARGNDHILLSVSDNGIGIPSAYTGRIFEKFFRVPSGDHHNIKGYGLGLSYVQHIVTSHDGTISVESKEGKGSTFTIQLPDK